MLQRLTDNLFNDTIYGTEYNALNDQQLKDHEKLRMV
jgi:hypothetical protein